MATVPTQPAPQDPVKGLLDLLGTLGTGTTTTTTSGGASSQADDLIRSIQESTSPEQLATLIQGILNKAKEAMGPNIAASIGSGARATSDSSLALLQGNAAAKATADSAQAILEARNNSNKLAVQLADTKLTASRSTKTGISPAGKGLLGLTAYRQLTGKKAINKTPAPEELGYTKEQLASMGGPEQLGLTNEELSSAAVTDVVPSAEALSGVQAGDVLGTLGAEDLITSSEGLASGISAADAAASADALDAALLGESAGAGAAAGLGTTAAIEGGSELALADLLPLLLA